MPFTRINVPLDTSRPPLSCLRRAALFIIKDAVAVPVLMDVMRRRVSASMTSRLTTT
jgi:hypothetical protein